MRNLTLIFALIIGTTLALSAQRGGISSNSNTGSNNNSSLRGNSNLNRNPNLGNPSTRSGHKENYGRDGRTRPGSYGNTNNGRSGRHGSGHHNNHYGHNNNHHNNHHGHNNNHGHHSGHGHHTTVVHHNNNHHGHHGHGHNVVTVSRHGHNYNGYCSYTNHNYGWRPVCVNDFNTGCYSIRSCGFDSDRLRAAKRFVRNHYVSSHQIADIMDMFSFESTKLSFAKYAFHRTCDVQNYGIVFDYLTFNSSRRELDCYIRDYRW